MVFYRYVSAADLEKEESVLGALKIRAARAKGAPGNGGLSGVIDIARFGPRRAASASCPGDIYTVH